MKRRDFLKTMGAGAAVVAVPAIAKASVDDDIEHMSVKFDTGAISRSDQIITEGSAPTIWRHTAFEKLYPGDIAYKGEDYRFYKVDHEQRSVDGIALGGAEKGAKVMIRFDT